MIERTIAALVLLLLIPSAAPRAEERAWQTGKWVDVRIIRPRVVFGVISRDPAAVGPRSMDPVEDHLYVVETDALRLEFKQKATPDRRIDATIGEPVTFALEKNTIYVKDRNGKEHVLSVTKKTAKTK